jgi:hypothetical protein
MRLFLALGLTLIVGLGAAFRPGDNLPGREVGAAESSRVIGGGGLACSIITCGFNIPCAADMCVRGPGGVAQCNTTCTFNGGCGGG